MADQFPERGRSAQTMAFFPTPVWVIRSEWANVLPQLKDEILRVKADDPEGIYRSNKEGWQSKPGILRSEPFRDLVDWLLAEVRRINSDLKIDQGWANVSPSGSLNSRHVHPLSVLSGVFYIDVTENSGNLIFEDPRSAAEMIGGLPNFVSRPVPIKPEVGMLVLFPAWLPHRVEKNLSDSDRISLAFNAFL